MMPVDAGGSPTGYENWAATQKQEESAAKQPQKDFTNQDTDPTRQADNEALAWNRLRLANRDTEVITYQIPGDPTLRSGLTVQVSGFGVADGIYLLDKISHKVSAGGKGYVSSCDHAHKRLEGYGPTGTSGSTGTSASSNPQAPATNPTGSSIPGASPSGKFPIPGSTVPSGSSGSGKGGLA